MTRHYCGRNAIRAELTGINHAEARGITVRSMSPVLDLARKLVAAGYDPATPLEAWRGSTLCLTVRSIGEAARLRVTAGVNGPPIFTSMQGMAGAPPVAQNLPAALAPAPFRKRPNQPAVKGHIVRDMTAQIAARPFSRLRYQR